MTNSSISQFSIYNFFSVLLPGLIFISGLYPLLPGGVAVGGLTFLLPILAIAFAIGQLIHILSVGIERVLRLNSHRDTFVKQLTKPSVLSQKLVTQFYNTCHEKFDHIGLTGKVKEDSQDKVLMDTLYVCVRSQVDIDGRGRTQIFQAIYAFCRSVYITALLLSGIYIVYALLISFGPGGVLPYETKLEDLEIGLGAIVPMVLLVSSTSYYTFRRARTDYRKYFVQYLMVEFLSLSNE